MDGLIELSTKINELFSTDQDFHAEQQDDGRYFKKAGKVTFGKIKHMLDNGGSIAVYQRNINDKIKWICYDFDIIKSQLEENNRKIADLELKSTVSKFCNFLDEKQITYLIEHSGNRGIHIWLTFENDIPFKIGHEITALILEHAELNYNSELIAIDLFPHSNKITNSVGSCVKLPLSKHKKSEAYSFFLESKNNLNNITQISSLNINLISQQRDILDKHQSIALEQIEKTFNVFLSQNHISYFEARIKEVVVSEFSLESLLTHWENEPPLKKLKASIQNGTLNNQERKLLVGLLINVVSTNSKKIGVNILTKIFESQKNYNAEITQKAMHLLSSFYFPSKGQIEDILKERFSTAVNNVNLLNVIFIDMISYDQGYFDFCVTDVEIVRNAEMKYLIQNDEAQSRKVFNELCGLKPEEYLVHINEFIRSFPTDKIKYYKHDRIEDNKVRELISLECLERMVTSMTLKQIHQLYNLPNSNSSHGYKVRKGFKDGYIFEPWLYLWIQFLSNISSAITNEEYNEYYIIKTDITSFYNRIDHDKLKRILLDSSPLNGIKESFSLLDHNSTINYKNLITICLEIAKKTVGTDKGLPQGPAYARFFAELYLSDMDSKFEELLNDGTIVLYQRYVDDIFIVCKSEAEANKKLDFLSQELSHLGLELKHSKTLIKKVKDFSPDYDNYRSQSKYSVDRISIKYPTATDEEKSYAINEFINLVQSDSKQDDYSFIFSHLKGVQEVEPFKNNEIPKIIESGIGRGSLYRNLFVHILEDENIWYFLKQSANFNSLQSEVLTSTIINFIEEGKNSHSKFIELMHLIQEKLTLTKMVEEHLLQMNLLMGFEIDYTKIPAHTIIDVISIFPLKLHIETTEHLLSYINTELNSMHDKYKFMNVMYAITRTNHVNKSELNRLSSLFYSYISLHMNKNEFEKKGEDINEALTYTIKYHYLISLFSLSKADTSRDLLISMWKYCASLFNSSKYNINEKIDYSWIHKITLVELDTNKLYVLLSSIVDGEIFRGTTDSKSIFKTYHTLLLIRLFDKISELNVVKIDDLLREISNESKFYEWIINRDKTDLLPDTRDWFDNNIIYNNTIILKRDNQVLIRKPHELFRATESVDIGGDGYGELIENYDVNSLSTITNVISNFNLKQFIEFLALEVEKTNTLGLPNIFSNALFIKENSLEPFTPELYSPRSFIFEENNNLVSIKDCSKSMFIELMFKKYAESQNLTSIEIYDKYISKLPKDLEMDIFLKHLSIQLKAFNEMDDMSSSILLDLSSASALYSCLEEQYSSIQSFERFTDFYIPNDTSTNNLHIFSVNKSMSISDASPTNLIDSILTSINTTKTVAYPFLILNIDNWVADYLKTILRIISKDENSCPVSIDSFKKCQIRLNHFLKTIEFGNNEKFSYSEVKVINHISGTIDDLAINNAHYINTASHIYESKFDGGVYLIAFPSSLSKAYYYIDNKYKSLTPQMPMSYHPYEVDKACIAKIAKFENAVNVIKIHRDILYQDAKELLVKWLSSFPEKFREIFVLIIAAHQYMTAKEIGEFCNTVLELIDNKKNAMMIKKVEDFNGTIRCFHTNKDLSRKLASLNPNCIDISKSEELYIIADVIISGTQICNAMTFYLTGTGSDNGYFEQLDKDRNALKNKLQEFKTIKICCVLFTSNAISKIEKTLKKLMPNLCSVEVINGRDIDGNAYFETTTEIGNADKSRILEVLCDEDACRLIYNYLNHPQVTSKEFRRRYILSVDKVNNMNLVARFQSLPKRCFDFLYFGLNNNHDLHPMERVLEINDKK